MNNAQDLRDPATYAYMYKLTTTTQDSPSKRTPCITRRLLYTEWGTILFTLKWLSANLEQWPSFNQAEQFKQPGFTQRNYLIFDVKHDYRITVHNSRLFVQVASGAVIFKWYILRFASLRTTLLSVVIALLQSFLHAPVNESLNPMFQLTRSRKKKKSSDITFTVINYINKIRVCEVSTPTYKIS